MLTSSSSKKWLRVTYSCTEHFLAIIFSVNFVRKTKYDKKQRNGGFYAYIRRYDGHHICTSNSKIRIKRLVAGFPARRPGFKPGSSHAGFVVDKVALGRNFSEYFGFPLSIFIPPISPQSPSPITRGWYNKPVSARSTQSPTPQIKKKKLG
jgi:hypothetical protein